MSRRPRSSRAPRKPLTTAIVAEGSPVHRPVRRHREYLSVIDLSDRDHFADAPPLSTHRVVAPPQPPRQVPSVTPARGIKVSPNLAATEALSTADKSAGVCKDKPLNTTSKGGGSRPFVPWCKNKRR